MIDNDREVLDLMAECGRLTTALAAADKQIELLRHERNFLQKICAERSDELASRDAALVGIKEAYSKARGWMLADGDKIMQAALASGGLVDQDRDLEDRPAAGEEVSEIDEPFSDAELTELDLAWEIHKAAGPQGTPSRADTGQVGGKPAPCPNCTSARRERMIAALHECAEYFEPLQDIRDGECGQLPNEEMRLLTEIRQALGELPG